ncbi:MAG TPA: hypothetical protein VFV63_17050, partial [Ilumatobacteraceae bacterium]|nr:hypothetical protein [Ilumatobacteraceae bacterium]
MVIRDDDHARVHDLERRNGRPVRELIDVVGSISPSARVHTQEVVRKMCRVSPSIPRPERIPDAGLECDQFVQFNHV